MNDLICEECGEPIYGQPYKDETRAIVCEDCFNKTKN